MTTITERKAWEPPTDLEVLPHTDELLALRERRERAEADHEQARLRVGELLAERDKLERRLLDGDAKASRQLAELNVRIAHAPGQVAAAADELAGSMTDWSRHVQNAAEDVRLEARRAEKELNHANGLDRRHLLHNGREIPGAREEIRQAVAESQPLRDRQSEADRLKADARSQVRRLFDLRGNGRFGLLELGRARRRFVEQARTEAAAEVAR